MKYELSTEILPHTMYDWVFEILKAWSNDGWIITCIIPHGIGYFGGQHTPLENEPTLRYYFQREKL